MGEMKPRRILLIENSCSDFYKTRFLLVKYLMSKGWEVFALIPNGEYIDLIQEQGIKVFGYDFNRKDKGILQLLRLIPVYKKIVNENDINIIHSFRFQPNLLNVLANIFNERKVILHITGLGIAFSNSSPSYLFLRFVSQIIFLFKLFRANKVIVQNNEDAEDIWGGNLWKSKVNVIKGSGVDISYFNPVLFDKMDLRHKMNISDNEIVFICVTRLIWEKGIKEMVDAFQAVTKELVDNAKLLIVGWSDEHNPRHVEASYINEFKNDKNIQFLGRCDNVRELLALSDVFIYPSYYREGIPRGILEALSMGLPIITTNMPGCNLTVIQNQNGLLISPKSWEQVKEAVKKMINENNLLGMGIKSRLLVENSFSEDIIFSQIEDIYKQ